MLLQPDPTLEGSDWPTPAQRPRFWTLGMAFTIGEANCVPSSTASAVLLGIWKLGADFNGGVALRDQPHVKVNMFLKRWGIIGVIVPTSGVIWRFPHGGTPQIIQVMTTL